MATYRRVGISDDHSLYPTDMFDASDEESQGLSEDSGGDVRPPSLSMNPPSDAREESPARESEETRARVGGDVLT